MYERMDERITNRQINKQTNSLQIKFLFTSYREGTRKGKGCILFVFWKNV